MDAARLCWYAVLLCMVYHLHTSGACPKSCFCFDLEKGGYSVSCNGPNVTAIPRDVPKNITVFDISFTPITTLRKGDFVDMPKLKELRVWWNVNLTIVEVDTFDNLPTLTTLGLYNNSFTKLPTGLFSNLKALTRFDAHNSKLEWIQRGLFTDHPSLEEIQLFFNDITELEDGAFGGLPQLTSVYLPYNRISSLSGPIFEGSRKLKSLDVSGNNIVTLDNHVFMDTPNLQNLYLSANDIESIDVGAFYVLQHLQSLSLDGNRITNIDNNFHNLPTLESISLGGNKISVIRNTTFIGLPALSSLDLSSNVIVQVEDGAFEDVSNLRTLYLQSNQIQEISLAGLNSLGYLSMDSNKLKKFPGDLKSASPLQTLSLGNNPIQEALGPGQFSVLHSLKNLYLNNIGCLQSAGTFDPKALCGSDTLGDVYLSYNGLISIAPTTFQCTPTITMLYLHHNNLTSIDPSLFHPLTQLWWLDLSYNQLSYVAPDTFLGLDKLISVDLTYNNFTNMAHVAPSVAGLPVLLYQSLDGNPFVYLGPESFPTPFKHSTELDISHGHIRVVEEGTFSAESFPNITRLQLDSGNPLHFLPANVVDKLPNLTALILYDDPFHCDCQLKGFATWLRERVNPPFVDVTCASPPSLQGKDLNDVTLANLTCDCQHEEAPSIDTSGSDTSVHEGQTAMLKCEISGCPEAEFFWTTPTGAMLAVESGFPRMEVLGSGTLVVTEAREEDTGVYTCTAVNYRGKARKEVALQVVKT